MTAIKGLVQAPLQTLEFAESRSSQNQRVKRVWIPAYRADCPFSRLFHAVVISGNKLVDMPNSGQMQSRLKNLSVPEPS